MDSSKPAFLPDTGRSTSTAKGTDFSATMSPGTGAKPADWASKTNDKSQESGSLYNKETVPAGGVSLPATLGDAKGTASSPYKITGGK